MQLVLYAILIEWLNLNRLIKNCQKIQKAKSEKVKNL
jgi:hypothetical protein